MKKILLLSILVYSQVSFAQNLPQTVAAQEEEDLFIEEAFVPIKDMKIFHDKPMMYEVIQKIQEQQDPVAVAENLKPLRGVFNEKDSATLESFMQEKNIEYVVTDDLLAKAAEQPFEAFKDLVKTAKVSKLSKQDMETLNTVDKKAVTKMMLMVTESGPDVGANQVPVVYNNE